MQQTNYEDNILQGMAKIMFLVIKESEDQKLILLVHEKFISTFEEFRKSNKVSFDFLRNLILSNSYLFQDDPNICRDRIMERLKNAGEKESRYNSWSFLF